MPGHFFNCKIMFFKASSFLPTNSPAFCLFLIATDRLLAGFYNGKLQEFDLIDKTLVRTIDIRHIEYVFKLSLLSEGLIITGSADYSVKIIDLQSETCIKTYKQNGIICCVGRLNAGRIIYGGDEKILSLIS